MLKAFVPGALFRTPAGTTIVRDVAIVSTARTTLAKSARGRFNCTHPITLSRHALQHAMAQAGVMPGEVEDVILGTSLPAGATGFNIARNVAIKAGCPPAGSWPMGYRSPPPVALNRNPWSS